MTLDIVGIAIYTKKMDTRKIIEAVGGRKAVIEMTGLTRGRIYQWMDEENIPTPWLKFFEAKYPDLDWGELLGTKELATVCNATRPQKHA